MTDNDPFPWNQPAATLRRKIDRATWRKQSIEKSLARHVADLAETENVIKSLEYELAKIEGRNEDTI
jgi:septal ring factor EnvC (AmiA/AmiB activator)